MALGPHKRILVHSKASVVLFQRIAQRAKVSSHPGCDLLQFLPVENDKAHLHFSTFWRLLVLFVRFLPSLFLPLSLPFILPLFLPLFFSPSFLSTKL